MELQPGRGYGDVAWLPVRHGVDRGMKIVTKGAVLLSEM
jgi:hypothetical protein